MFRLRTALPSWVISALVHVGILAILAMIVRPAAPWGSGPGQTLGISLDLQSQADAEGLEDDHDLPLWGDRAAPATLDPVIAEPVFADRPPIEPAEVLASRPPAVRTAPVSGDSGNGRAAQAASTGGAPGAGGKGRTGVFGVEGEGNRFVYVFDRSASMGGAGRGALQAAKAELLASLGKLGPDRQFQIVFYNEQPRQFSPHGDPSQLAFATEENKRLAAQFVAGITAEGSTEHEQALLAAIKLKPDTIFFLTDADQPELWPRQLESIHRLAQGIAIHAIEFGFGPQSDPNNFLVRLARQNGGNYGYVDIARLGEGGEGSQSALGH